LSDAVKVTHPEKVLFPDSGITKGDVCLYYEAIAPLMLPHVTGRPVTMERFPAGIGKRGFIHKDVVKGFPAWLQRVEVERRDEKDPGTVHYPLANDTRALVWMANQNSITPHVWCARVPRLERPDLCVFDLDPPGDDPAPLRAAALAVRDLLDELGLPSFVKTSGSKGFHIAVSLDGKADSGEVSGFAHAVGSILVARDPEHLTQEFSKADRGGRILVDTGRNGYSATFAAAYAVRAKPGAPVSAPCTWEEVESGAALPQTFTLRTMAARLSQVGDLWGGIGAAALSLRAPMAALEGLLTEEDWRDAHAATTRRPVSRRAKPRAKKAD